jgi:hypothetical protein
MDPEALFYSIIPTNNQSNNPYFVNYSFHGCATYPTPLHSAWDIQYNPLKK